MADFAPWMHGQARTSDDGKRITATLALGADTKLEMEKAEIVEGTFLVVTFRKLED